MILVDTSVWVDHLRRRNSALVARLERAEVAGHPFVIGELSLGTLARRDEVLTLLSALPMASVVAHAEVLELVERRDLAGRGIGWVDVNLIASALVDRMPLWTLDKRLATIAREAHAALDA